MTSPINAVIGVWAREARTYYVRRSAQMQNYPGVWSLLSIQFDPAKYGGVPAVPDAQELMEAMSRQRLGNIPLRVERYLTSATCADNPMQTRVFLHMYAIELLAEPVLAPNFYAEGAWMTPAQYRLASERATCGLCMRMWSDYCVRNRLSEPFAPPVSQESIADALLV